MVTMYNVDNYIYETMDKLANLDEMIKEAAKGISDSDLSDATTYAMSSPQLGAAHAPKHRRERTEHLALTGGLGGGLLGAIAGTAISTGVLLPTLVNIPYVGWLAAGWATLLGNKIGSEVGSEVGSVFNDC